MFTDIRSRKVVLVAHCFLNQNAISDGTADFPGAAVEVVQSLLRAGVGIVQLPCPELSCLGLDRGDPAGGDRPVVEENTRIREGDGPPAPARLLATLVEQVVHAVEEYRKHGFAVLGILGSNRSPSCGVETTSRDGREIPGQGVFLEALQKALVQRGGPLPMLGIKAADREGSADKLAALLGQA